MDDDQVADKLKKLGFGVKTELMGRVTADLNSSYTVTLNDKVWELYIRRSQK